jgi:iron complex outermembrane receptor protein
MSVKFTRIVFCVLSAIGYAAAVPAQAPGETGGQIEEVVVTAQFRQQSVQDTPVSITAVDAGMLEARSQTNITAIAEQAPNVTLKPAAAPFGPTLQAFIRGVGQYDFNYALEPGVGMYVDDVYYSTSTGALFDLLDLDRVEVLRGPQGTLAGQNSIGGAIKLFSKKPDGNGGGYVQATYGQLHRTDLRAGGDFTLIDSKAFLRVSGVSHHQDGYVTRYDYRCTHPGATQVPSYVTDDNCVLGTEGGKAYDAARVSVRLTPTDKWEIALSGDYTNDNSEAAPLTLLYVGSPTATGAAPTAVSSVTGAAAPGGSRTNLAIGLDGRPDTSVANGGVLNMGNATGSPFITNSPFGAYNQDSFSHSPYVNYSNYADPRPIDGTTPYAIPAVNRISGYGYSANIDYRITDTLSLKSIAAYRYYKGEWSIDEDGTPIGATLLHNSVWHRQASEELRLNGKLFGVADFTVGGLYFKQKSHYGGRVDLLSMAFIENDYIPASTKAGFAHVDWKLSRKLDLLAGLRYTKQEKTFTFGRLGVPGNTYPGGVAPAVAALNNTSGTSVSTKWDYRGAMQYRWTDALMTYAQLATGFKGGGVNPRPFFIQQELPFKPETLTAYELGAKSDWFDRHLRLNGAVFLNKYKDIVLTVNNCPLAGAPAAPCAMPVNAGVADIKGAELEATIIALNHLTIDASGSYLNFKYTSISQAAQNAGITPSMESPFAPRWKFSVGAQYQWMLGRAGSLTPRLDWSHQSAFYSAAINSTYNKVDGYGLLNARVTWRGDDNLWDVSMEVTNLTDKLYYLGIFDNRGSSRTVMGEPAPPRQWAVSIKRTFK